MLAVVPIWIRFLVPVPRLGRRSLQGSTNLLPDVPGKVKTMTCSTAGYHKSRYDQIRIHDASMISCRSRMRGASQKGVRNFEEIGRLSCTLHFLPRQQQMRICYRWNCTRGRAVATSAAFTWIKALGSGHARPNKPSSGSTRLARKGENTDLLSGWLPQFVALTNNPFSQSARYPVEGSAFHEDTNVH